MRVLRRLRLQRLGIVALGVLHLAPPLAIVGAEQVAQDGEQPGRQVRAGLERVDIGDGAQQRLLHQVVGTVAITGKRDRERAQAGDRRQNVVARVLVRGISPSRCFCRCRPALGRRRFRPVELADQLRKAVRHALPHHVVVHGAELMADPGLDFGVEAALLGRLVACDFTSFMISIHASPRVKSLNFQDLSRNSETLGPPH